MIDFAGGGVPIACFCMLSVFAQAELPATARLETNRARLIVLADMGNEPDEAQQIPHLLMR